jgi:pyruvate/2-oxoglutarate dehydrogenase complex dihydrolipoamide dehydrogenase (E3) component
VTRGPGGSFVVGSRAPRGGSNRDPGRRSAVGAGAAYGGGMGLVKIVAEKKRGELCGQHVVGAKSTELINELVQARVLEGGTPRSRA